VEAHHEERVDGGILLLATMKGLFPFLEKLVADAAYQGPLPHTACAGIIAP
jgi:hypothetical protein